MARVPSGSESINFESSFEIFEMSVPRWSVIIARAFCSIVQPLFVRTNSVSQLPIS